MLSDFVWALDQMAYIYQDRGRKGKRKQDRKKGKGKEVGRNSVSSKYKLAEIIPSCNRMGWKRKGFRVKSEKK